jgi:hypothetical protein
VPCEVSGGKREQRCDERRGRCSGPVDEGDGPVTGVASVTLGDTIEPTREGHGPNRTAIDAVNVVADPPDKLGEAIRGERDESSPCRSTLTAGLARGRRLECDDPIHFPRAYSG